MNTAAHPWIVTLRTQLDALEAALLRGDGDGVERASAQVQSVLKKAPKPVEFDQPGTGLRADMLKQAQRFGQLRQTVLRANGHNERALRSLMPGLAKPPTYGRPNGVTKAGGAGRTFLSA